MGAAGIASGAALAPAVPASIAPKYTGKLGPPAQLETRRTVSARLIAAERPTALPCFGNHALPLWTFSASAWPPVIRLNLGDRLETTLENRLPRAGEFTSMHWHGLRIPNGQDGVPYLTQEPVAPGASFRYSFTPPDSGTFFFHTHCDTAVQWGRGLQGVLIVDGDTTEPYDADTTVVLRDWQVEPGSDEFGPFFTRRGAGRAGTFASVRSANGEVNPEIPLPASGDCRLRLLNLDATRIMQLRMDGADAAVIAVDGAGVAPFPLSSWTLGPAMRLDLLVRSPANGAVARLIDESPDGTSELARFAGTGAARRKSAFDPAPLRAPRVPEPDLKHAKHVTFTFDASVAGKSLAELYNSSGAPLGSLCLSQEIFWTINGRPWPGGGHARIPAPLAVLERDRSYILTLKNSTPFTHPIHVHGYAFKVLRATKLRRPVHYADTVLLLPDEEVDIAFVADNPGDWMFHCHIIEHQESGMMGYIRVT